MKHDVRFPMLSRSLRRQTTRTAGFTLVELLVVIAIIAILAAMLLPVLNRAKTATKIKIAQVEMNKLVSAIRGYESAYNRFPVSSEAMKAATSVTPGDDYTFGMDHLATNGTPGYTQTAVYSTYRKDNSEVMAILLDLESVPASSLPTINQGHVKNPQKTAFLNATMASDTVQPGVGKDLIYRDPWGSPYIITLDLNYDEKARDGFYRTQKVSQQSGQSGFNGLVNSTDAGGAGPHFDASTSVMVWSLGPDKKCDFTLPANVGVNKDNILSWKQ